MIAPTPLPVASARLTSPRIYLVRIGVFLVLVGFIAFILQAQLRAAFFGNPGLNGLIVGILLIGIILAILQVARLFREVRWVNHASGADTRTLARPPVLLAPVAAVIGDPVRRTALSIQTSRSLLEAVAARLDENRELVRYLAGLLVFLGLLGTFWGLIETVNSVGRIIGSLRTGSDAAVLFDELKSNLAAPLSGMGVSFSASLFGLAGSLILGFLDLQAGQAQNRFYTELEDWLAATAAAEPSPVTEGGVASPALPAELATAIDRLAAAVLQDGGGRGGREALANLAEGVQGLVQHMRTEQQLIRDWVEAHASRDRELRLVLERLARERA
ncbi:MAG: flagellar motor protein MotA [Methylobacteriaceae bacterium]|nr:flagellar motor protein MotA [Methylobacteriaceae bacterium]